MIEDFISAVYKIRDACLGDHDNVTPRQINARKIFNLKHCLGDIYGNLATSAFICIAKLKPG